MGTVAKKGDGKEGEVVGVLPQGKAGTSDGLWWTVFGGLLLATFWTRLHKVTRIQFHSSFLFISVLALILFILLLLVLCNTIFISSSTQQF
jgi:hypothetical protein